MTLYLSNSMLLIDSTYIIGNIPRKILPNLYSLRHTSILPDYRSVCLRKKFNPV